MECVDRYKSIQEAQIKDMTTRLTARAGINLLETQENTGASSVSASAAGNGASASSEANMDLALQTLATSDEAPATNNASANAIYASDYTILGNTADVEIPLTFNFAIAGNLSADSVNIALGFGSAFVTFNVFVRSDVDTAPPTNGNVDVTVARGELRFRSAGALDGLEASKTLVFENQFSIDMNTEQAGRINAALTSTAATLPGGGSNGSSSSSLVLESVTVPSAFGALDVSDIELVFDTGVTFDVFRQGDGETFNGSENADRLAGTVQADILQGRGGNDSLQGNDGDDGISGGAGNDTLFGNSGNDILKGNDGLDQLSGGIGNDTLDGGTGNDTLDGGPGIDTMAGKGGNDVYVVDTSTDVVNEAAGDGRDVIQASVSYTLPDNIETLVLVGSANINGTGNTLNNRISGNSGRNSLRGLDGNDRLLGDDGNDRLAGGSGNDRLLAGAGSDRLVGNAGNERLVGGDGNDTLLGGVGNDTMIGGANNDRLLGAGGRDLMQGNLGNDTLNGGGDNDRLFGGAGRDRLNGQGGNDVIRGGGDSDVLNGGTGNDRLAGELGDDIIFTGSGRDRIVIRRGQGFDTVRDFEDGSDRIVLGGIRFEQLSLQQIGNNVRVSVGNQNLLLLQNVNLGELSAADFV